MSNSKKSSGQKFGGQNSWVQKSSGQKSSGEKKRSSGKKSSGQKSSGQTSIGKKYSGKKIGSLKGLKAKIPNSKLKPTAKSEGKIQETKIDPNFFDFSTFSETLTTLLDTFTKSICLWISRLFL